MLVGSDLPSYLALELLQKCGIDFPEEKLILITKSFISVLIELKKLQEQLITEEYWIN